VASIQLNIIKANKIFESQFQNDKLEKKMQIS